MSISNIFAQSANATSPLSTLMQELSPPANAGASAASSTDSAELSQPGQLFSQLQQLASSNPAQFKQIASTIASQLTQAASQQSGSSAAFFNNLATKFSQAAQTGSAVGLAPNQSSASSALTAAGSSLSALAHAGGHHQHGGAAASLLTQAATSAYSSQAQDPLQELTSIIQNALNSAGTSSSTTGS